MYSAILRAHLLGQALSPAQRALTATREAALVSTALDLTAPDLVLDAVSSPALDFLRGMPLHRAFAELKNDRVPHPSFARVGSKNLRADSGSASRVAAPADATARLWSAVGIAASIKASEAAAKRPRSSAHDSPVVILFTIAGDISAADWKPALAFAAEHDLPIIFVVLPPTSAHKRSSRATKSADLRAVAHRAHVPAMPVDAADPVALYRVAQESIGHARIGGGPALIECISFPAPTSRKSAALAHLELYILQRGIATQSWFDREASAFATQIRSLKRASK
jgi:TPP-dependent pyruvate/acetoin dehydrogenase alpha subunit